MGRITKLTTGVGDEGWTYLVKGKRVLKSSPFIQALGTMDELNSAIGVVRCFIEDKKEDSVLKKIQHTLFKLGADIATPVGTSAPRIKSKDVRELERWIGRYKKKSSSLEEFILPNGSPSSAFMHLARTVARRAERWVVSLSQEEKINKEILVYLNRLSDLLFVLARVVAKEKKEYARFSKKFHRDKRSQRT